MNLYAKALLLGALAGTAWTGTSGAFGFMAWRDRFELRTPVVVWARDLRPGAAVSAEDVRAQAMDPDVLFGSALGRPEEAIGRVLRCPARQGEIALRGCLEKAARPGR